MINVEGNVFMISVLTIISLSTLIQNLACSLNNYGQNIVSVSTVFELGLEDILIIFQIENMSHFTCLRQEYIDLLDFYSSLIIYR